MDLSVFLILLFVTLNFVAECYSWSPYRVKLGIFIATVIITLPNIIFMVIDWWQSPHSKMALLVLNTFKPILRGETYRLFRWLKSVGMGLTYDDINYLPISNPTTTSDFFVTKECFQASTELEFKVIPEGNKEFSKPYLCCTNCTSFIMLYENKTVSVHQLKFSKKLSDLWKKKLIPKDFMRHLLVTSSLIRSQTYNNVDQRTAKRLRSRLEKICRIGIPILSQMEIRREWLFFRAAPTLDNLNEDLVLIQGQGESIAVG